MRKSIRKALSYGAAVLLSMGIAQAKTNCPQPVNSAIQKAYPDAKLQSCKLKKAEKKDIAGKQYEAKLKTEKSQKVVLDLDPEGVILLTEEQIKTDSVPAAVVAAFEEKYPKAIITVAERQTDSAGVVNFEIAFKEEARAPGKVQGKTREATFKKDGSFVEEE